MFRLLSKGLDWTENALAFIGGVLLVFSMLSIAAEVVSRYFFHHSFIWVNEISEYILLYIPFLGAAWLLRINGHVTVDLIEGFLSGPLKRMSNIFIGVIGLFVSLVLVWYGIVNTIDIMERDIKSLSVLEIPQVYVIVIIPIGSLVLLLEFIRMIYRNLARRQSMETTIQEGQ